MSRQKFDSLTISLLAATAIFGCLGAGTGAAASPVTYTIFAITDVSLDSHFYHNAHVYLKFVGDTNDIQPFTAKAPDGGVGSGVQIAKGQASLLIISGGRHIRAKFKPNQILVSLDTANGGGGFSSAVGPNGLEPAYPLAIDGSSISIAGHDLVTPKAYTGHAWSCVGFPPGANSTGRCFDPIPLKTDRGDFRVYQPYQDFFPDGRQGSVSGSLNTGIFSVIEGR